MKFDGIEHQSCENTSGEFSVQSSCETSGLDRLTETVEVAESGKRCGGAAIESQLANAIKLKFEWTETKKKQTKKQTQVQIEFQNENQFQPTQIKRQQLNEIEHQWTSL